MLPLAISYMHTLASSARDAHGPRPACLLGASLWSAHPHRGGRATQMEPLADFAQLQLHFVDHVQWRYEVIRPLVLCDDRTAAQRAVETHTHPETVRKWHASGAYGRR